MPRAIEEGYCDLTMLARPLLADPEYADKVASGRADDIVRCDRENQCVRRLMTNMPVRCTVDPRMGRESELAGSRGGVKTIVGDTLQGAVLKLTGSRRSMGLAGRVISTMQKLSGKRSPGPN